jgi:hypothetical protein
LKYGVVYETGIPLTLPSPAKGEGFEDLLSKLKRREVMFGATFNAGHYNLLNR